MKAKTEKTNIEFKDKTEPEDSERDESVCVQTLKGGISETRIEKRIVISGDTDIDHDQVTTNNYIDQNQNH